MTSDPRPTLSSQSGNILFYVLMGIVLVGVLTAALRQGSDVGMKPDVERLAVRATEVQRYATQLQQGVMALINKGVSESDIRFAHPRAHVGYGTITTNPNNQVFYPSGGNVEYALPVSGVNDGSRWEFYGTTRIPQVGSDLPELIAVLPNVTKEFCTSINDQLGFTSGTQPTDDITGGSPDCVYSAAVADRFTGGFDTTPNTLDDTTFTRLPMMQGCVRCGMSSFHYFYVLLAR